MPETVEFSYQKGKEKKTIKFNCEDMTAREIFEKRVKNLCQGLLSVIEGRW